MSLLFQPIYNPHLDKLWDGRRGSSKHGGLNFPLRYGLTKQHVEMLVKAGQWSRFKLAWLKKRQDYLRNLGLGCYVCGFVSERRLRIGSVYLCSRCMLVIDRRMRPHDVTT